MLFLVGILRYTETETSLATPHRLAMIHARLREFARRTTAANPSGIIATATERTVLARAGVTDPTAQKYAVWRRSVLWIALVPCTLAAVLGLINVITLDTEDREFLSHFGVVLLYVQALALFALPVAAVLAACCYDRLVASTRIVLIGGIISLTVPLLVAIVPGDWIIHLENDPDSSREVLEVQRSVIGMVLGVQFYLILMPSVLSLLPAVSRACVRIKTFLPESLAPGWGLVASVPLFVLLTIAAFVLLYHLAGNLLLIFGLVFWVGAPLLYLTRYRLLTRPVTNPADLDALAKTQRLVMAVILVGIGLLIIYLFTARFLGKSVIGLDSEGSLIRPWELELHKKWIEFIGRSLFLTVLFADVLMHMALSVWREENAFTNTPAARVYDERMAGLASALQNRTP